MNAGFLEAFAQIIRVKRVDKATLIDTIKASLVSAAKRKFGQGRRLFKMSPLHHHFELLGWSETQVVQRFWLVELLAAMAGVALALW